MRHTCNVFTMRHSVVEAINFLACALSAGGTRRMFLDHPVY